MTCIFTSDADLRILLFSIIHCVKSVRNRSYSGPHFSTFGLNMNRYTVSLRIQSKCGKTRTRITPNTDTFYAVIDNLEELNPKHFRSMAENFYENLQKKNESACGK